VRIFSVPEAPLEWQNKQTGTRLVPSSHKDGGMQGSRAAFFALSVFFLLHACAESPPTPSAHPPAAENSRQPSSFGPNEYAAQKLRAKGLSEDFLQTILTNYREDQREKVLELNFLGFLRPNQPSGDERIPYWELKRVHKFLNTHRKTFSEAEKEYRVGREVIASLLWVETKHGRDVGTFHVASALLSQVEADYPTLLDHLLDTARQKAADYDKLIEARIQERTHTRSDWAAGELLSLQELHERGWKDVTKLNGSFSGAFGMAQFMPSSYLVWAKSRKKKPNLFHAEDSIYSVANYLSSNGWEMQSREKQEGALFHYNRDKAYVNRILRMSECLRRMDKKEKGPKRITASAKTC
jgi:membrane-bound lytic murein transglycosylase B